MPFLPTLQLATVTTVTVPVVTPNIQTDYILCIYRVEALWRYQQRLSIYIGGCKRCPDYSLACKIPESCRELALVTVTRYISVESPVPPAARAAFAQRPGRPSLTIINHLACATCAASHQTCAAHFGSSDAPSSYDLRKAVPTYPRVLLRSTIASMSLYARGGTLPRMQLPRRLASDPEPSHAVHRFARVLARCHCPSDRTWWTTADAGPTIS